MLKLQNCFRLCVLFCGWNLRCWLFDPVIFAANQGPKVIEAARAFCTNIILILVRHLHGSGGASCRVDPNKISLTVLQLFWMCSRFISYMFQRDMGFDHVQTVKRSLCYRCGKPFLDRLLNDFLPACVNSA